MKWSDLPKCLVTSKICLDYYRGRCKRLDPCSYKEEVEI